MLDESQRRLLGGFIRAHRERARLSQISSPSAGRRRTPGLRREELAAMAGISATWCAWIEQGRPVQASPDALSRLAKALRLSSAERAYLFELAGRGDPEASREQFDDAPRSLATVVAASTDPAYGLDRLWNVCCWNAAAARLFAGWLDADGDRNLLRFVFLDPTAKELLPDWSDRARRLLPEFRADFGRNFRDPRMRALVDALRTRSPEFLAAWNEQDVHDRTGGLRLFNHARDGRLSYAQYTFIPSDGPDHKLVILSPAEQRVGDALSPA